MRRSSRYGCSSGISLSTRCKNDYRVFGNASTFQRFKKNVGADSQALSHFNSREPHLYCTFWASEVAPHISRTYATCPAHNSLQEKELKSKRPCALCKVFTTQSQCKKAKAHIFMASLIPINGYVGQEYNFRISCSRWNHLPGSYINSCTYHPNLGIFVGFAQLSESEVRESSPYHYP